MKIEDKHKLKKLRNITEAKKRWREGEEIFLLPAKMNLFSPWATPCPVQKDRYEQSIESYWHRAFPNAADITEAAWHSMHNDYSFYNLQHAETGRYAHFYVMPDDN